MSSSGYPVHRVGFSKFSFFVRLPFQRHLELRVSLDANVTRFPFIFFNLSGFSILLVTTCPLRRLLMLYRFLRNDAV